MVIKRYPIKITPPTYEHVFERARLFKLVEQKQTVPLIWVNGPPGSGKTVFVASLLNRQRATFLWYRIDSSENNLEDIFYFLALAANKNYPWKKLKLPIFTPEYADNVENFARIFFRQLFAVLTKESAVVLDNCQEVEKDAFFSQLLHIIVNELPHGMQLICISRNRPDTALKRLCLNNELLEIGSVELKFNNQESQTFLKWLNPQLTDHHIHHIQSKTQGWTAGMVLMVEQFNITGFVDDSDINKNISDYLISELLSYTSKERHKFFVPNALFTQFTVAMSEELTGCQQAKRYLDELVTKNFLIECTTGSKPSYEYHPLFREVLLNEACSIFAKADWLKLQHQAAMTLIKQDRSIEAMSIYRQLEDWPSLKNALLQQAEQLIKTGRHRSVSRWVETLPADYLDKDAWLNYWYAVALKPATPLIAAERLEKSYQQFITHNDIKGIYSSWQAAVESISVSMDGYSGFNVWITRFDEIRKNYPACPSIELKARFYATAVHALSWYNPHHSWLQRLVKKCEYVLRFTPIDIMKAILSTQLGYYYQSTCQVTKLQAITPFLESALNNSSLPALPRIMGAHLLALIKLYAADANNALTYLQTGLEISKESGIHLLDGLLLINILACHINNNDLISAEKALKKSIECENIHQRMPIAQNLSFGAWLAALEGNKSYALKKNQQALELTKLINVEIGYVCSLALEAQFLAELAQWKKAEQTFSLLFESIKDTNSSFHFIQYHVTDAWLAYLQQNQSRMLSAMQQLLQILHADQMLNFFGFRPEVMIPLCIEAIENDIEQAFAIRLLQCNQSFSTPPHHLEKWPWPIRIYSFGSLVIEINGRPLEQSGKSQKKIIELLSTIILLGGRNVSSDKLGEILWPDADGDLARKSIETGLHRLRKLIGKESVLLNAGMISLNDRFCWLDLWAFEATADELEHVLKSGNQQYLIAKLTDRLIKLYQDTFLGNYDSGLVILKQEQLLNKLFDLLSSAANFYNKNGENERTCHMLKKGLELKPLLEVNYSRLMSHYIALDQPIQAIHIYQQCKQVLNEGFNIPLSNEIQSIAKQLRKN